MHWSDNKYRSDMLRIPRKTARVNNHAATVNDVVLSTDFVTVCFSTDKPGRCSVLSDKRACAQEIGVIYRVCVLCHIRCASGKGCGAMRLDLSDIIRCYCNRSACAGLCRCVANPRHTVVYNNSITKITFKLDLRTVCRVKNWLSYNRLVFLQVGISCRVHKHHA